MRTDNALSCLGVVGGMWEVLAPFILNYSVTTEAKVNTIIVGVILIAWGIGAALRKQVRLDQSLGWVNAVAGRPR